MFTLIRFILAVLTVATYFAKSHIPPRSLVLHPSELTDVSLYSPKNEDGAFWIHWLDASQYAWRCAFLPSATTDVCGFAISWDPEPAGCEEKNLPDCTRTASDADGDGWGWEDGIGSCQMTPASKIDGENGLGYPTCSAAAADHNNDGLSWEAGRTCRLAGHAPARQPAAPAQGDDHANPVQSAAHTGQTAPTCSPEAEDPDGDGWGWENEQSCQISMDRAHTQASGDQTLPSSEHNDECDDSDLNYPGATMQNIDLSHFDGIKLSASYEGTADFLKIYLINQSTDSYQSSYSDKFMSAFIPTLELKTGAVYIPLDDFTVEPWWELQNNPRRAHAGREFNRISTIGIDPTEYGTHRVRVDRLELVGERISSRTFLVVVLCIWTGYLIFEAALRYLKMRSSANANQKEIDTLSDSAQYLTQEKASLHTRSITDPLTQTYNRAGAAQWMRELFGPGILPPDTGLMVLDIDHFKVINDTQGHEAGDIVLREFAALILATVRNNDLVARWGGEEFLLLFENVNQAQLMTIAEKLRSATAQHAFTPKGIAQVTVSIGVTSTVQSESFEQAFKRADEALYRAKHTRNKVVYG